DPTSGVAVEYRERVHWLTPEQQEMYDLAAKAWQVVLKNVDEAIKITGGGKRQRANAMTKFWGDHQRFFCQVITAFKVPAAIQEVEQALAEDKSVVLSLVSTGEARTREQVAKAAASGGALEDLDFTPREVIAQMVERGFPTTLYQDVTDPATGRKYQVAVEDKDGNKVQSREALRMKERLLDGLSALRLPENPLDQIVNHFGESVVAELTGRSRRLIRDKQTGHVTYKKRAPQGVAMDSVNIHEMEQFQAGRKRVAIISDAASMGISLHASNQCENKQRRVHITLQLGWSADKQLQVFGRTHRSDQAMPPEYVLLSTNLGGERRFSSTIARRLASLGALTKGDRSAADSGDLAKYNFETEEGRSALLMMFARIKRGDDVAGLADPKQTLRDMGLLQEDGDGVEGVRKEDERNIPRFLNRVLALEVERQNAIFEYFSGIFDLTVLSAKENGTFDEGVTDIRALAIRFAQAPRVIATDETTGAKTTHYLLEIDREVKTCTLESVEIERHRATTIGLKTGYYFHNKDNYVALAVASRQHTDTDTGRTYQTFAIWKPTGARVQYRDEYDLASKFRPVPVEQASLRWQFELAALPPVETTKMHVIGGAILPLWRRLRGENESRLKVVRVTTDSGQRIVGAQISAMMVGPVLRAIGVSRNLKTPEEIFAALLEGDRIQLVAGMHLCRSKWRGEIRIELGGNIRYGDYELFKRMGLISEYISYTRMFFVPTDPAKGIPALTALLKQYQPLKTVEEVARELAGGDEPAGEVLVETFEPVDVRKLIVPVEMPPAIIMAEPELAEPVAEIEPEVEPVIEKPKRVARSRKEPLPVVRPAMVTHEPVAVIQYDGAQGLLF
ncbi:MAG: strawberry notch C-terminal domain-containing protein, partial [Acidobacteria bacterium]|nr:strawberry notch C-terminal domain-containing protein [Acidobacteriota bacterium]